MKQSFRFILEGCRALPPWGEQIGSLRNIDKWYGLGSEENPGYEKINKLNQNL